MGHRTGRPIVNTLISQRVAANRGDRIASDLIGEVKHPLVKLEFGSSGEAREVSSGSALPVEINTANSPSSDAFGRFRVSSVTTLNDFKQVHGAHNDLVWSTASVGSGSIVHDTNRSSTIMTVHTSSGDERIHQTKGHFRYTPGISFVISMTGILGPRKVGSRRRMGFFNVNDGIYLQVSGTTLSLVERNSISGSVSEVIVDQADWNTDRLDGFGPSEQVLDLSKTQIFVIDFQWLGSGRVRCGFYDRGRVVVVHEFLHANRIGSAYMATPTLPIRWENTNLSTTESPTTLEQNCFAVCAEGQIGTESGIVRSANRGINAVSIGNTKVPVISLRLKAENVEANVVDIKSTIVSLTAADFVWEAVLNPIVSDEAVWVGQSDSIVEVDTTRSGSVSGGTVLASGYGVTTGVATVGTAITEPVLPLHSGIGFGEDLAGKRDEIVISVQQVGMGPDDFLAALSWRELT